MNLILQVLFIGTAALWIGFWTVAIIAPRVEAAYRRHLQRALDRADTSQRERFVRGRTR